MLFNIFLYIISSISGTQQKPVISYSTKFCWIYFKPSQIAMVIPQDEPNKNVVVLSKVWCKGRNDKNLSLGVISIIWLRPYKSIQIAYCESITALEMLVVPEVNNITDIAILSIFTELYFFKFSSLEFCIKSLNSCPSMQIDNNLLFCFFETDTAVLYLSQKIIASEWLLSTKPAISWSGKDLSSGTTTNPAVVIAK